MLAETDHPDKGEIDKLMDSSFTFRRILIIRDMLPVTVIKEKYPTLFSYDQVCLVQSVALI